MNHGMLVLPLGPPSACSSTGESLGIQYLVIAGRVVEFCRAPIVIAGRVVEFCRAPVVIAGRVVEFCCAPVVIAGRVVEFCCAPETGVLLCWGLVPTWE
jgi:hypothetical protein